MDQDPLWQIEEEELPLSLSFRIDEPPPGHGVIEPRVRMSLDDYEAALATTRTLWRQTPPHGAMSACVVS
jgi:hypothetical protein